MATLMVGGGRRSTRIPQNGRISVKEALDSTGIDPERYKPVRVKGQQYEELRPDDLISPDDVLNMVPRHVEG